MHLRDHIDWEEHILAPVLRAKGADGVQRAVVLEREHEEQRELHSLLECLRADMAREDAMLREEFGG